MPVLASQVIELFLGQVKGEIFREAIEVTLHGPNQSPGLDVIKLGQIGIEHDAFAADYVDLRAMRSIGITLFSLAIRSLWRNADSLSRGLFSPTLSFRFWA